MYNTYIPLPSVNNAAHPGFETQRRCHQKSQTGVSVALQKGLMSLVIYSQKRITEKLGTSLPFVCQMHIGKLSFMNFFCGKHYLYLVVGRRRTVDGGNGKNGLLRNQNN